MRMVSELGFGEPSCRCNSLSKGILWEYSRCPAYCEKREDFIEKEKSVKGIDSLFSLFVTIIRTKPSDKDEQILEQDRIDFGDHSKEYEV